MFRYADVGKVWVPVPLPVGGEDEEVSIHLLFRLYTRKELRERERNTMSRTAGKLVGQAKDVKTVADLQALFDEVTGIEESDMQDLLDRTSDWRGVVGEGEAEEPYSRERMAALLEYNWFFQSSREALFDASRSGVAKNSKPGPGGMPARVQA